MNQRTTDPVRELLDEIRSRTIGSEWRLDLETLLSLLSLSREDYYRSLYTERLARAELFDIRDHYDQECTGELLRLLERTGYQEAESLFFHAGYHFPEEKLLEWHEFFLSVTWSRLQSHEVERDSLENALLGCSSPSDGLEFYARLHFPAEELMEFAIPLFCRREGVEEHTVSFTFLADFIRRELKCNLLGEEELYHPLAELLRRKGREWDLLDEEPPAYILSPRMEEDLAELGFDRKKPPALADCKVRYRELLKRYHPDINPEGGEKTRRLNAAYGRLMSDLYAPES